MFHSIQEKDDKYSLNFVLWSSPSVRSFHHIFHSSCLPFLFRHLSTEVKGTFLFLCLLKRVKRTYTLFSLVTCSYTYVVRSIVLSLSPPFFPLYYKIFCVHDIIISLCSVLSILHPIYSGMKCWIKGDTNQLVRNQVSHFVISHLHNSFAIGHRWRKIHRRIQLKPNNVSAIIV